MAEIRMNVRGRPRAAMQPMIEWQREIGNWIIEWLNTNSPDGFSSSKGKNATYGSRNSLFIDVDKNSGVSVLAGNASLEHALAGRKAGKFPPPPAIREWILAKPVAFDESEISLNSLAFLIGRKIAESGTYAPKLRKQNIELVVNQKGKKYNEEIGQIQAREASAAMVGLLTRNIPNTTKK